MDDFVPLGVREKWVAENGPYEGVPDHLRQSLLDWVQRVFYRSWRTHQGSAMSAFDYDLLQRAERQVRFASGISNQIGNNFEKVLKLLAGLQSDERLLLSVIDFVLYTEHDRADADQLDALLREGGSIFKVERTSKKPKLERRVEPHLENIAREEIRRQETGSELLRVGWSATFGQSPNPSEGYRNAVRAVEAAAVPVVLPNDPAATLGKVLGHLAATKQSWRFVLPERRDGQPSIQTVIDVIGSLWTSQYDRHVTDGSPLHIGQPEADAALPLAALLDHWFTTGAVDKN